MERSRKARLIGRGKARGAALVEGALLFPIMVMFLPYMTYFHNIHRVEFEKMGKSRKDVWTYTSKSCTGGGASTSGSSDTANGYPGAPGDSTGKGGRADSAPVNVRNGIIATGYATASGTADASPFNVRFALTHRVKAESWNFCNEITVDPESTGIFSQIISYARGIA